MMTTTIDALDTLVGKLVEQVEPKLILNRLGLVQRTSPAVLLLSPIAAIGAGWAAGMYADDLLVAVGLRRSRSTVLGGIGAFAIGGILGAGVALALAPTSGRELRQLVAKRVEEGKQRLTGDESSTDATGRAAQANPA